MALVHGREDEPEFGTPALESPLLLLIWVRIRGLFGQKNWDGKRKPIDGRATALFHAAQPIPC